MSADNELETRHEQRRLYNRFSLVWKIGATAVVAGLVAISVGQGADAHPKPPEETTTTTTIKEETTTTTKPPETTTTTVERPPETPPPTPVIVRPRTTG